MKNLLMALGIAAVVLICGAIGLLVLVGAKHEVATHTLPVTVKERPALVGSTLVAEFFNNSDRALPVKITFHSPTFGRTRIYDVILEPGRVKQIGHTDGWAGAKGDSIKVESAGYIPLEVRF